MQMDLTRHSAAGTLAELLGDASPSLIDSDIQMRAHHFTQTCTAGVADAVVVDRSQDQTTAKMLTSFAAGVNAYIADLQNAEVHAAAGARLPLRPADDQAVDRGRLAARRPAPGVRALVRRRQRHLSLAARGGGQAAVRPVDEPGAGGAQGHRRRLPAPGAGRSDLHAAVGLDGDERRHVARRARHDEPDAAGALRRATARASTAWATTTRSVPSRRQQQLDRRAAAVGDRPRDGGQRYAPVAAEPAHLLPRAPGGARQARHDGRAVPRAARRHPRHERARGLGLDGEQHRRHRRVPGDDRDLRRRRRARACRSTAARCRSQPRTETIKVGRFGDIINTHQRSRSTTCRTTGRSSRASTPMDHTVEPLGSTELSVKLHRRTIRRRKLAEVLYGLDTAKNDAGRARRHRRRLPLRQPELGDRRRSGALRLDPVHAHAAPRRHGARRGRSCPATARAEWGGDLDPVYIPHAYDPAAGFLATANNDPIGVTDDGDPFFDEPMVDGAPLYLGADYDPGTRVGRITKRIKAIADGGGKLTLDDMQSIQADAVSEWAQALAPDVPRRRAGAAGGDRRRRARIRSCSTAGGAGEPDLEAAGADGDLRWCRTGRATRRSRASTRTAPTRAADRRRAGGGARAGVDAPLRRSHLRRRVRVAPRRESDAERVRAAQAAGRHGQQLAAPEDAAQSVDGRADPVRRSRHARAGDQARSIAAHAILDTLDYPRRRAGPDITHVALGQPAHADAAVPGADRRAADPAQDRSRSTRPAFRATATSAPSTRPATRSTSATSPTTTGRRSASSPSSIPRARTRATCCRAARCSIRSSPHYRDHDRALSQEQDDRPRLQRERRGGQRQGRVHDATATGACALRRSNRVLSSVADAHQGSRPRRRPAPARRRRRSGAGRGRRRGGAGRDRRGRARRRHRRADGQPIRSPRSRRGCVRARSAPTRRSSCSSRTPSRARWAAPCRRIWSRSCARSCATTRRTIPSSPPRFAS